MPLLRLQILLPFEVFLDLADVSRIVAETSAGYYGILPQRLDCVATLIPGILTYESERDGERFLATDEGVLVKTGLDVLVAARNAMAGETLEGLREVVEREFKRLDEREKAMRSVLARLENSFVRRFLEVRHE
jgi:F-type H+-transporting ATPase subunit epsilon